MKLLVLIFFLSIFLSTILQAQNAASEPPEAITELPAIHLPDDLQPYAEPNNILATVETVIDILASAKFAKATYSDKADEPPCDSLNRGMMLAHAGFNMFVNTTERGWTSPTAVLSNFGNDGPYAGLVSPRRGLLLRVWSMSDIERLIQLRLKLKTWPQKTRGDLGTFLTELLRFRKTRNEMILRFPERIKDIKRRETPEYAANYRLWRDIRGVPNEGPELAAFHIQWPEPLSYSAHSEALYKSMKEIPGEARPLDECLQETSGALITFSGDTSAFNTGYSFPIRYMFTFWERRDSEGLSNIAEFAIKRVIEAIR